MRVTAVALVISFITFASGNAFGQDLDTWRRVAEAIPLGTKVKVQTTAGKRVSGTLIRVDSASVMVKKNTRLPEPAVVVPFDVIANIEKDTSSNGNVVKAILIGAGVGAGVLLTMFAIALQFD